MHHKNLPRVPKLDKPSHDTKTPAQTKPNLIKAPRTALHAKQNVTIHAPLSLIVLHFTVRS